MCFEQNDLINQDWPSYWPRSQCYWLVYVLTHILSLSLIYRFFVNHKHFFDAINLLPHAKLVTSTQFDTLRCSSKKRERCPRRRFACQIFQTQVFENFFYSHFTFNIKLNRIVPRAYGKRTVSCSDAWPSILETWKRPRGKVNMGVISSATELRKR